MTMALELPTHWLQQLLTTKETIVCGFSCTMDHSLICMMHASYIPRLLEATLFSLCSTTLIKSERLKFCFHLLLETLYVAPKYFDGFLPNTQLIDIDDLKGILNIELS